MITFLTLFIAAMLGSVLGYLFGHNAGWEDYRAKLERIGNEIGVYKG